MPIQPSILATTIVVPVAVYLQDEAIRHPGLTMVLPVKPRSVEMLSKCFLQGLIQHPAPLPSQHQISISFK